MFGTGGRETTSVHGKMSDAKSTAHLFLVPYILVGFSDTSNFTKIIHFLLPLAIVLISYFIWLGVQDGDLSSPNKTYRHIFKLDKSWWMRPQLPFGRFVLQWILIDSLFGWIRLVERTYFIFILTLMIRLKYLFSPLSPRV